MENKVYIGKYLEVTEEEINGHVFERAYFRKNTIVIYPITENGKIILIKELRVHETPQVKIRPITGFYEEEYSFEENVNREMQEEVGLKSSDISLLLKQSHKGSINVEQFFAVAKNLEISKIPNPDGDVILEVLEFNLKDVIENYISGKWQFSGNAFGLFKMYYEALSSES